jgi:hypothetical protein
MPSPLPVSGLTARAETAVSINPVLTGIQFVPLLVERKTPYGKVPAKRYVTPALVVISAKAFTIVFGTPLLQEVQLTPLLVERKTPPSVPAKIVVLPVLLEA